MESLKNEYIEEYRNPNSIEIIKIKHSSAEESNNLLIHLITIKEIKKIKQYRHFANSYTSKLFETYILGLSRATETEYRSKSIFGTENN